MLAKVAIGEDLRLSVSQHNRDSECTYRYETTISEYVTFQLVLTTNWSS